MKNDTRTCVVVTVHPNEDQVVLATSDGEVVIDVRHLAATKAKVAVLAPPAVRISRRNHVRWEGRG